MMVVVVKGTEELAHVERLLDQVGLQAPDTTKRGRVAGQNKLICRVGGLPGREKRRGWLK
jgi:hypothetical protein